MVDDEAFVRLAKLDPAPELYEGTWGFWGDNRAAIDAGA